MQKNTIRKLLALTVIVLMGVGGAVAADRYVPSDYATIQAAIDASAAGDVIHVAAGTHDSPTTIIINSGITITGPDVGVAIVRNTAVPTSLAKSTSVFEIAASNVTIEKLDITVASSTAYSALIFDESQSALIRVPNGSHLSGIIIRNNNIYVPAQPGAMTTWGHLAITLSDNASDGANIYDNTVYNTRNGIVTRSHDYVTITNNVIYNTKGGIMNYTADQADADNRIMTGNSWGTVHNEWDMVWNTFAYFVPDYQLSVLALSNANNGAYVVDRRAIDGSPTLTGNRSHVFVNGTTGTLTVSPVNGNMNVPYKTITLGIAAVVPGGKVYVAAGTYAENVVVNKSVSLLGSPGATLNGTGLSGAGFEIKAADITVNGFEIRNYLIGVRTFGGYGIYGDLQILSCYIHHNTQNGMLFQYDIFGNVLLDNNQITSNAQNGIGIANYAKIDNLVIQNSSSSGNGQHGMFIANALLTKVLIENSTFDGATSYGSCGITFSTTKSTIGSFTMNGGSLSGNTGGGLYVAQTPSTFDAMMLKGVTIQDNHESGVLLGGGGSAGDLTVENCTFQGNAWEDFDLSGGWFGAFSFPGTAAFTGNLFNGGPAWAAIYVGNAGVFTGGVQAHSNFFAPGRFGIWNENAVVVNATCNYWGDPSGPTHATNPGGLGDVVSDRVTFYPWWGSFPSTVCGVAQYEKIQAKRLLEPYLTDPKFGHDVEEVIKKIDESLDPKLWDGTDWNRLNGDGKKVFDKEKDAVKKLWDKFVKKWIEKDGVYDPIGPDAQKAMFTLINADDILAQVAIADAVLACTDPMDDCARELGKANEEYAKALENLAKEKYPEAIDHFKHAWEKAMKASKKALAKEGVQIPTDFVLSPNYPNPFNPTTTISFTLPVDATVSLAVYDVLGRTVAQLVEGRMITGFHDVEFDASNLSSGVYFYRMSAVGDNGKQFTAVQKMLLTK